MTYQKRLHKDRQPAYCSQCYFPIRLRCPVCLLTEIPRHCRIYKNLASLWWHIKQEHGEFTYSKLCYHDVLEVLNNLTKAVKWGIIPID